MASYASAYRRRKGVILPPSHEYAYSFFELKRIRLDSVSNKFTRCSWMLSESSHLRCTCMLSACQSIQSRCTGCCLGQTTQLRCTWMPDSSHVSCVPWYCQWLGPSRSHVCKTSPSLKSEAWARSVHHFPLHMSGTWCYCQWLGSLRTSSSSFSSSSSSSSSHARQLPISECVLHLSLLSVPFKHRFCCF